MNVILLEGEITKITQKNSGKYNKSVRFVLFFRCQEGLIWQPDDRKVSDDFFPQLRLQEAELWSCWSVLVLKSSQKLLTVQINKCRLQLHTHTHQNTSGSVHSHTYSSRPPSSNGATSYLGSLTADGPISA